MVQNFQKSMPKCWSIVFVVCLEKLTSFRNAPTVEADCINAESLVFLTDNIYPNWNKRCTTQAIVRHGNNFSQYCSTRNKRGCRCHRNDDNHGHIWHWTCSWSWLWCLRSSTRQQLQPDHLQHWLSRGLRSFDTWSLWVRCFDCTGEPHQYCVYGHHHRCSDNLREGRDSRDSR